jgi:Nucleotidyl transferase of unknown function (DUF2204)
MATNRDFSDLLSELSAAEARFLVVGAHAVVYHSVPRYTKDLDLWIEPSLENARHVFAALQRFGAPLRDLKVEDLTTPGIIFQIGVEPNRIDLLTDIEGLDFESAWQRRVAATYGDVPISILSLDDLLASKRAAGRPQDLLDAEWLERSKQGSARWGTDET